MTVLDSTFDRPTLNVIVTLSKSAELPAVSVSDFAVAAGQLTISSVFPSSSLQSELPKSSRSQSSKRSDAPAEIVPKVILFVEECAMTVVDDNGRSRGLLSEISFVISSEETRMVMRDTGKLRDITDDDARVSSLRSFVISGLMRSHENRRYLTTIGCNRAAFVFSNQ